MRLERSRALGRYALFCVYSDLPSGPEGSGEHILSLDDVERWIDAGEDVGAGGCADDQGGPVVGRQAV